MSSDRTDEGFAAHLRAVARAGEAAGQPQAIFTALDEAVATTVGRRMTSVMRFLPESMELVRLYSNQPAYRVGSRKSKRGLPWSERVLVLGQPFVGSSVAELRWAFDDAETLIGLGLGAVINQPIVWNGKVLGTLNVLDAEGCYQDPAQADAMRLFANLLTPALLFPDHQPSA